jgi:CHAT domain-containing protein/tetratricopeptide (TPR) repeat protein
MAIIAPLGGASDEAEIHHLAGGEVQEFSLDLADHQAIDIDLEQLGGTVALDWSDPSNRANPFRFTQDGLHGHIRARIVAEQAGAWRIRIATRATQPVEYRLRVGVARAATAEDSARAAAGDSLARAEQSRLAFRANGGKTLASGDQARVRNVQIDASEIERDYRDAIAAWGALKDSCETRAARNGYAHFQIALGQYAEAFATARAALDEPCEDDVAKAHSLRVLQSAAEWLGDLDTTIETGERALPIYLQSGDRLFQGLILGNLSSAYVEEGATAKGLDAALEALGIARAIGDREGIVFDEETVGAIHLRRGEYQLALDALNHTLEELQTYPYPDGEAMAADDLGHVYGALGDMRSALRNFRRSEQSARTHNNPSILADALNDEGSLDLSRRRFAAALRVFKQAIALTTEQHMARKRARAERGLGAAETGLGRHDSAEKHLREARDLARALHDSLTEIEAEISIGDVLAARHMGSDAEAAYQRARELAHATLFATQQAVAAARVGELKLAAGDAAAARPPAEEALAIIESQRTDVNAPGLQSAFYQSTRSYYDLWIRVLMALHAQTNDGKYVETALEAAENSRARALTDLLSERAITVRGAVPDDLVRTRNEAEDTLHAAAYHRSRLPDDASPEARSASDAAIEAARHRLDQIEGEVRAANRRFGELTRPTPLSIAEIQSSLLDPDTLLVEFWLGERESYVWQVSSQHVESHRLPSRATLETLATELRGRLSFTHVPLPGESIEQLTERERARTDDARRIAARIARRLLTADYGRSGKSTLVVVADGALRGIPFEILPVSAGATLQSRHTVSYLPSVAALRWLRSHRFKLSAERSAAVIADPVFERGDPRLRAIPLGTPDPSLSGALADTGTHALKRLPYSREEAREIAAEFPLERRWLALDFNADRSAIMDAAWERYEIAHFATHALIDTRNPELSGIVLSLYDRDGAPTDGYLRITDIYNLHIPAELVVLSTCDSAADSAALGNDVFTLADAFYYAGAPRLLASLWAVNDEASATFMTHFYRALVRPNATPASALKAAKQRLSQDPRWHSPAYWSAFVLEGDWQ